MGKLVRCFSIQQSIASIFTERLTGERKTQDKEFLCLEGVRVLTLNAIILGNTFFYILNGAL
jgi:hypothetical protein